MVLTDASREMPIRRAVDLWVRMSRLAEFLEGAKSEADLREVRERARRLIRDLSAIPDAHAIPRGLIMQTLERMERDPSPAPTVVAEVRRAMCRCNDLLDRRIDPDGVAATADAAPQ